MALGPESRKQMRIAALAGAMGIEMALSVSLGLWVGKWVDSRWHTGPWGLYTGLAFGAGAGFRALYRFASKSRNRR